MHHLASNWIPPNERSKFVTAYMGKYKKKLQVRMQNKGNITEGIDSYPNKNGTVAYNVYHKQ